MQPRRNLSCSAIKIAIAGGALAAAIYLAARETPLYVSKTVAGELKARAIADAFGSGGPWSWLEANTTQRSMTVDPPTNLNGRIQTIDIVFDDRSKLTLLVDAYNHIAYRASSPDPPPSPSVLLDDWTQPGFMTSTGALPTVVPISEVAATDLKISHHGDEYITVTYGAKITSRVVGSRIGLSATYTDFDYRFNDGSRLALEVVATPADSFGAYMLTAYNVLGAEVIIFSERGYIPYRSPDLINSILYPELFKVATAYGNMPSDAKNIVGAWLDTLGPLGVHTLEQDANGVIIKGRQYDITTFTTVVQREPMVAADLVYDRNSTATVNRFAISIYFANSPSSRIETHNTFPSDVPYNRTSTTAWACSQHMVQLYMQSDSRFITPGDILSTWDQHAQALGGVLSTSNTLNEYFFADGSSAQLAVADSLRQFRILMSAKIAGVVKDTNYPVFTTDFWGLTPSPPERGLAHKWLASYLKSADILQRQTPSYPHPWENPPSPHKDILTINNVVDILRTYSVIVRDSYNSSHGVDDRVEMIAGDLDVSSRFLYAATYVQYVDKLWKYLLFLKYERYFDPDVNRERFAIQMYIISPPKYIDGRDRLLPADYWNQIQSGSLQPEIYYTSPDFQN